MRLLDREPEDSDFMSAEEYENSVPASFGLPESPVLYIKTQISPSISVWIASDGVHIWEGVSGVVYELNSVFISNNALVCPGNSYEIDFIDYLDQLRSALTRCVRLFGNGGDNDSVEIAVPLDYETGDADDLGDSRLAQSIGEGMSSKDGPAIAQKRRRSS